MNTSRTLQSRMERFGLFALVEARRVVLPLKGVECEFSVRGGVAEVCLRQIFRQENPKPLDCEYLFPLPADASVYSCEADVNGRIIRAEIKERGEARKFVAEKRAEGFRTALVESERDNLFTLGLGNVQPEDMIIIQLKYFQTLRALDEMRSVEIPFCPGVRYIPGKPLLRTNRGKGVVDDTDEVPDASRITPVRIDAEHPDAAYIDVRGKLDAQYADRRSLTSPSHSIEVESSDGELGVTLSSKGEVPDRDFVLRWSERNADTVAPRAWVREKGKDLYALLEVRAPRQVAAQRTALDFYFLVDRSGSMEGDKWNKAVEALQTCIQVLGPDDRAMVTLFEDNYQDFAERPLPARELLEDRQFQKLQQIGTGGGTEMAPALQHVLEIAEKESEGRDRNLILITDAQIGNETAILDLMKTAPDMAVHCFGIDIALNDALLLALSRQQGGTFHSLNPNDDIQAAITTLGKTLRQPVLLNLQLSQGWECADAKIPDLYSGQIVYLSARASAEKPLELTARTPSGDPVGFNFQQQALTGEAPYLHWSKSRIQRLLAAGNDREAIGLSVASNLLCRLTAFVAWDESEKVIVARHELVQPSMEFVGKMGKMRKSARSGAGRSELRHYLLVPAELSETVQERSAYAPSALRRFFRRLRPDGVVQDLQAACQRLGGKDWLPFSKTIADWFVRASDDELVRRTEALKRLIEKLNICSELKEALGNGGSADTGDWVKRLRVCQLQYRKLQQQWKADAGEFKELEDVFRRVEALDSLASAEQLTLLAQEIHRQAIAMVKSFAEDLLARK